MSKQYWEVGMCGLWRKEFAHHLELWQFSHWCCTWLIAAESRCGLVQDMPNIGTVQKVESSISSLIYLLLNSFICVRQLPLACATLLECILCASSEIKNSLRYITVGFEAMSAADSGLNLFALFLGGVPFKGLSGDVCGRFSDWRDTCLLFSTGPCCLLCLSTRSLVFSWGRS